MNRRFLLFTSCAILVATRSSFAQEILGVKIPNLDEFVTTITDEARFRSFISGVWMLREILVLAVKPDSPNEGVEVLERLIKRVENGRDAAIQTAKGDEKLLELPTIVVQSIEKIGGALQELGVQQGSVLFKYLIDSYMKFNQALATTQGDENSLCSVFPFRIWCST